MNAAVKRATQTHVLRGSCNEGSQLIGAILPGLQAMGNYSGCVQESLGKVTDSIDLDKATRVAHPQANRWDFVLGVTGPNVDGARRGECLIGVEVHSAKDDQVSVIIAKKRESKTILQGELRPAAIVSRWCWVASGKVGFSPNSKYRRLLAQKGIEFTGRTISL